MVNGMNRRFVMLLCTVLAIAVTCSSCETLRKKFTRQKKKDRMESNEFNPVLEPQDYPEPQYNAVETYQGHYNLVKVWYKDVMTSVTEKLDSDSRGRYAVKQINSHLDEMAALLNDNKKPAIESAKIWLKNYTKALDKPRESRNRVGLQSDLREFDRQLRNNLRIDKIKKDLVKLEAPR